VTKSKTNPANYSRFCEVWIWLATVLEHSPLGTSTSLKPARILLGQRVKGDNLDRENFLVAKAE
jgi:hypothetical protein